MASYYAVIIANPGHLLLGGCKKNVTSRFESVDMAARFGEQAVKINQEAGRMATFLIHESTKVPEILAAEVCGDVE